MTKPLLAPLEIRRVIDATLAETWAAWTDPALVARWFAPSDMRAEVIALEVRKGGAYRIRMHDREGRDHTVGGSYVAVEPQRRIVMTWAWEGGAEPQSQVTVEFAERSGGTEIFVLHERLPDAGSIDAHRKGWLGCLDNLARTHASRRAS